MEQDECDALRRVAADQAARAQAQAEQAARTDAQLRADMNADAELRRQQREVSDAAGKRESEARREADRKQLEKRDAEQRAEDRAEAAYQRKVASDTAVRQVACGSDYLKPRIGMTIERALQCVGTFKVVAQVNRADGVLTTYRGNLKYLHVIDGRIVSWGVL